jgi:hypothetical protein
MSNNSYRLLLSFFLAFGVVLGAVILSGITAILTLRPPEVLMTSVSDQIKIWAVVAAIGGTIDPFRTIESSLVLGERSVAIFQILNIACAFLGAQLSSNLIYWMITPG